MERFRRRRPAVFWAGTVLCLGASFLGSICLGMTRLLFPYSAMLSPAEHGIRVSPEQKLFAVWFPVACIATGILGALVSLARSAFCRLPTAVSVILRLASVLGLCLALSELDWSRLRHFGP